MLRQGKHVLRPSPRYLSPRHSLRGTMEGQRAHISLLDAAFNTSSTERDVFSLSDNGGDLHDGGCTENRSLDNLTGETSEFLTESSLKWVLVAWQIIGKSTGAISPWPRCRSAGITKYVRTTMKMTIPLVSTASVGVENRPSPFSAVFASCTQNSMTVCMRKHPAHCVFCPYTS